MSDRTYWSHEDPPGTPARYNVMAGSVVYQNVAVETEIHEDGTPLMVLTHRKGDRWKIAADGVKKMVLVSPGRPEEGRG